MPSVYLDAQSHPHINDNGGTHGSTIVLDKNAQGGVWVSWDNNFYSYAPGAVVEIDILTGGMPDGDTVNINSTVTPVYCKGSNYIDVVTVGNHGSLAGINGGLLDFSKTSGYIYLTIDESADPTGQTATLGANSLTWDHYASPIQWMTGTANQGGLDGPERTA